MPGKFRATITFGLIAAALLAAFSIQGLTVSAAFFAFYIAAFGTYVLFRFGHFSERVDIMLPGPQPTMTRTRMRTALRRDRVRTVDEPRFIPGRAANDQMEPEERVLGINMGDEARAYPLSVLSLREVVNDSIGRTPIAITWSPICYAQRAYVRTPPAGTDGSFEPLSFGSSGKVVMNSSVYYDRSTDSMWVQFLGQAVSGPYQGYSLEEIPVVNTSWRAWLQAYPHTLVLDKGDSRRPDAFDSYYRSGRPGIFRQSARDRRWRDKDLMAGVERGDEVRAYPLPWLIEEPLVNDEVGGQPVLIVHERMSATVVGYDPVVKGQALAFRPASGNPHRPGLAPDEEEPEPEDDGLLEFPYEKMIIADNQTGSTWSALTGECVDGDLQGSRLERLPLRLGFWFAWSHFYPSSTMMERPASIDVQQVEA